MDATMQEDESYHFLAEYFRQKFLHYVYRFPALSYEDISILINNFTFFCAKVKDLKTDAKYSSNIPIGVFRYVLLQDMSWAPYYTVRRQPGFVVEGAYWSNGLFYQVREDTKDNFGVFEATLMIDPLTKNVYNFPDDLRFDEDSIEDNI